MMFFISLCLIVSLAKGGSLAEQLSSVQCKISALQENLTPTNIDLVVKQIEALVQCKEEMTEEEEAEIMELNEDGMFLTLLQKYIQSPSQKDLENLKQWVQCKPGLSVYMEKIGE